MCNSISHRNFSSWYGFEHQRLFTKVDTAETPEQDAMELLTWIEVKYRERLSVALDKTLFVAMAPNRLRTGGKLHVTGLASSQRKIIIFKQDNKTLVYPSWASTPNYTGQTSRF